MSTPASPAEFEITRQVRAEDLDDQRHVNNVVYLAWVQDVAVAHWQTVASEAARRAVAWVALRHEIDYLHPAVLGDALVVRTRVGPATGLTFERHTEIRRAADGRLLARGRTLWCPVDPATGRPRRVSAEVRAQFSAPAPDTFPEASP